MLYYLLALVMSIFLGTKILAISTPIFQLSIYRILALLVVPLLIIFFFVKRKGIKVSKQKYSHFIIATFILWWLWGMVSIVWSIDILGWIRGMFLLTIGISSLLILSIAIENENQWQILLHGMWLMMSFLVLLGFFEIITNHYFFADMSKLDKYGTFATQPWTRMPITIFENQNDFATMLLAYISTSIITFSQIKNVLVKGIIGLFTVGASFLIYQTGSRMSLLMMVLFYLLFIGLQFKWDFSKKQILYMGLIAILSMCGLLLFKPSILIMLKDLVYTVPRAIISGDVARVNMLRNGLHFVGDTLGMGVGAGNSAFWLEHFGDLPTNNIFALHNWWLEILVGYGVFIFIGYVMSYALMIYRLIQIRHIANKNTLVGTNVLIAFLIIFIGASITSANNLLIEWHWVFFGMIISYISINEEKLIKRETIR